MNPTEIDQKLNKSTKYKNNQKYIIFPKLSLSINVSIGILHASISKICSFLFFVNESAICHLNCITILFYWLMKYLKLAVFGHK